MPSENSVANPTVMSIGDPRDCYPMSPEESNLSRDYSFVNTEGVLRGEIEEVKKQLELVSLKVQCLPAIIVEAFHRSFDALRWDGQKLPLVVELSPSTDCSGQMQLGVSVDGKRVLEKIAEVISGSVATSVNFSELESLRKRVEELEAEYAKDIQKRKEVAEKLMQDYPKSPGAVAQRP